MSVGGEVVSVEEMGVVLVAVVEWIASEAAVGGVFLGFLIYYGARERL